MALDIYFRDDIRNVLRSAYLASEGPAALVAELLRDPELQNVSMGKLLSVYREGYLQALNAVGVAFGLVPEAGSDGMPTQAIPRTGSSASGPRPALDFSRPRDDVPELDMTRFLWRKRQHERRR